MYSFLSSNRQSLCLDISSSFELHKLYTRRKIKSKREERVTGRGEGSRKRGKKSRMGVKCVRYRCFWPFEYLKIHPYYQLPQTFLVLHQTTPLLHSEHIYRPSVKIPSYPSRITGWTWLPRVSPKNFFGGSLLISFTLVFENNEYSISWENIVTDDLRGVSCTLRGPVCLTSSGPFVSSTYIRKDPYESPLTRVFLLTRPTIRTPQR